MAAFEDERREKFARGLTDGMPAWRAWEAAGYARNRHRARTVAAREDVKVRITEISEGRAWGGSSDLAPVIDECMRLAIKARTMNTAAAMVAARGLLAEAARLKALLPVAAPSADASRARPALSDDEWLAAYAPKAATAA